MMAPSEFKAGHPWHYWFRLLLLSYYVIAVGYLLLSDRAEGAGTPIWEPVEYEIDETVEPTVGAAHAARGPDNIVRRVWQDDDLALAISWTGNNGSSWSRTQIIGGAWKGHTDLRIGGIVVLANNTTIVHFIANDADDTYNTYVACRWEWSGSWDIIKVYGNEVTELYYPKMALNETTILLTYITDDDTLRYKKFDPSDSSVDPDAANLPTVWIGSWENAWDYDLTVNQSGYFIFCSKDWSGGDWRLLIQDLDETHVPVYAGTGSGVFTIYGVTIMTASNDTFVVTSAMNYPAINMEAIYVWHETEPWGAFLRTHIGYAHQIDYDSLYSVGSCIDDDDYVAIYWANDTLPAGAVYISLMRQHYTATEADWEANIINKVYDYGTEDDDWFHTDWYDHKYPVVGGYSVNIPNAGWMGHHSWKDEQGTPDDYAFALYWNASFHWYDWELGPGGPGPGPGPSGDGGDDYFDNFTAAAIGSLWVFFVILALVATILRETWTLTKKGA